MEKKLKLNLVKLKREMEIAGWNKARLAREMGKSRQVVNYLFSSTASHRLDTIDLLGNTLGIDSKDLLI